MVSTLNFYELFVFSLKGGFVDGADKTKKNTMVYFAITADYLLAIRLHL